jgi:hypothetical protein
MLWVFFIYNPLGYLSCHFIRFVTKISTTSFLTKLTFRAYCEAAKNFILKIDITEDHATKF